MSKNRSYSPEAETPLTVAETEVETVAETLPAVEAAGGLASYRATGNRMHDPYQNITFTSNEAKPAECTPWVKAQLDAGYLVVEVAVEAVEAAE